MGLTPVDVFVVCVVVYYLSLLYVVVDVVIVRVFVGVVLGEFVNSGSLVWLGRRCCWGCRRVGRRGCGRCG